MIARFAFFAALLTAPPAFSQETPAAPAQEHRAATPAEITAARAEADAIIAAANAHGHFTNVTTAADPSVQHKASGLICHFRSGQPGNRISFFNQDPESRDTDVGCVMNDGDVYVSAYATRYSEPYTNEYLAEDAARAIMQRWPDATPYEPGVPVATNATISHMNGHAYWVKLDGVRHFTLVRVAQVGDWSFKSRRTEPAHTEVDQASLVSDALLWLMRLEAALARQPNRR